MVTIRDVQTDENTVVRMDEKTPNEFAINPGNAQIFIVTRLSRMSTFFVVFSLFLAFALTVAMLALTLSA